MVDQVSKARKAQFENTKGLANFLKTMMNGECVVDNVKRPMDIKEHLKKYISEGCSQEERERRADLCLSIILANV